MMKYLIIITVFLVGLVYGQPQTKDAKKTPVVLTVDPVVDKYYDEILKLSDDQLKIMIKSYLAGKDANLGYTLAAIAWKESEFGKYKINLDDGKYGSYCEFQIHLEYAAIRNKFNNNWSRSRYAERLLNDFDLCASEALWLMQYWMKYNKGKDNVLLRSIQMYNGGYKGDIYTKSKEYGNDVMKRITAIQRYFRLHKVLDALGS